MTSKGSKEEGKVVVHVTPKGPKGEGKVGTERRRESGDRKEKGKW
jgi:hypothetical protein